MKMENELVIEKDGKEVKCELYFSFVSEDTGKGYVAYTDHSKDESGKENVYVFSFDPDSEEKVLSDISDEEMAMVNHVVDKIKANV